MRICFETELWQSEGPGGWVFAGLPQDASTDLRSSPLASAPGFGSIRVRASLSDTSWETSIFYDTKRAQYLLPIKKQVRTAEGVAAGDHVRLVVQPVD